MMMRTLSSSFHPPLFLLRQPLLPFAILRGISGRGICVSVIDFLKIRIKILARSIIKCVCTKSGAKSTNLSSGRGGGGAARRGVLIGMGKAAAQSGKGEGALLLLDFSSAECLYIHVREREKKKRKKVQDPALLLLLLSRINHI